MPRPTRESSSSRKDGRRPASLLRRVVTAVAISATGYLVAAIALVASDPLRPAGGDASALGFAELVAASGTDLPAPSPYRVRDGATHNLRRYPSAPAADTVLVLLHGSGWHGQAMHALAAAVSDAGAARVVVPDLIDLERARHPGARVIVGGHSSGGGLAVRFAGGPYVALADGFVLLAPYLGHDAPTTRPDASREAEAYEPFVGAHADGGSYVVLEGASHLGLLVDPRTADTLVAWLAGSGA